MNTPLFGNTSDEITTMFNPFGVLEVTIDRQFSKQNVQQWIMGCKLVPGVLKPELIDVNAENTSFEVFMLPKYSTRTHEVQQSIRAYTERFIANLAPEPTQGTLF